MPEAQTNGFFGFNFIALICNSLFEVSTAV